MKSIPALIAAFFIFFQTFAQSTPQQYCGTISLGEERTVLLKEFQRSLGTRALAEPQITYYLPLVFHIVGTNEGNGYADLSMVLESICTLNQQYAGSGIQFYLDRPPLYINNSSYYVHNFKDGTRMMRQKKVPNRINVFFVQNAADNCGYYNPSADAVAIAKSCMLGGSTTLAHELGHYLSLPHTFNGWEGGTPPENEQERADGSNCKVAGDGFCDTRADYLADRWNCPYSGAVLLDPVGDTVIPDETQIMSYSADECQTRFSSQQKAAMRNYINRSKQGMVASELPYYGALIPPQYLSPDASNPYVNGTLSVFQWSAVPRAIGYQVQISRFFSMAQNVVDVFVEDTLFATPDLIPGVQYYWWVRPVADGNTCGPFSEKNEFSVNQITGLGDNPANMVNIYPNPAPRGGVLQIDFTDQPMNDAQIELLDLSGKLIQRVSASGRQLRLSLEGVSAGVYLLKIESDRGRLIRRVVVR